MSPAYERRSLPQPEAWGRERYTVWFRLRLWIGRIFNLKYNKSRRQTVHGIDYYTKKKRWHRGLVFFFGEIYLRFIGASWYLLSYSRWLERERLLYKALYGRDVLILDGQLYYPAMPGLPLSNYLSSAEDTTAEKQNAVLKCIQSLHHFHAYTTHGDATADNVLFDPSDQSVYWIDFETEHRSYLNNAEKKADDLLTLAGSAVKYFPAEKWKDILPGFLKAYPSEEVVEEALNMVRKERRSPKVYRYVQTGLRVREMNFFTSILLNL